MHHLLLSRAPPTPSPSPFCHSRRSPHKSLKIAVVNERPTHFLLNTPPTHTHTHTKTQNAPPAWPQPQYYLEVHPVIIGAKSRKRNCHYLYLGPLILMGRRFTVSGFLCSGLCVCVCVLAPPPPFLAPLAPPHPANGPERGASSPLGPRSSQVAMHAMCFFFSFFLQARKKQKKKTRK